MSKKKKSFSELKKETLLKKKDKEMETLCKKCGLCCYVKVGLSDGNYVLHPAMPCKYLNNDNTCAVYDKRFKCDVKCFTREEIINKDYLLPEGCPYTELREGYKPAKVVTQAEFDDIILKEIELGNYNVLLVNRIF
jgi:uncharacterized protein